MDLPTWFPKTYGEVMRPLDVNQLPEPLLSEVRSKPLVREWVHLHDRVRRAEKVSSWTQWTAEEIAAYEAADYVLFSRLRGYSEAEIEEYTRCMALMEQVDLEMSGSDCLDACWEILKIVRTPAYDRVEEILLGMARAAIRELI